MTEPTKMRSSRKMARPQPEVPKIEALSTVKEKAEAASLPKPMTKTALVLSLLRRSEGASLAQLIEATGWLPHTTRAALTGLKKKGHALQRASLDGESRYTIPPAAPE
jgi:DNA-binding MarR family transcriptional regulator